MATSRRPSYLKRQKEQARMTRANEKRTARLERKRNGGGVEMGTLEDLGIERAGDQMMMDDDATDDDTTEEPDPE